MSDWSHPPYVQRESWHNHTRNQAVEPMRIYDARKLDDLVAIVQEAESCEATVRAVGSGHSWSDVTLTNGFLVKTHKLNRVLHFDFQAKMVRVEAGMTIRALNKFLHANGCGLRNMGGYDAQTVAGVMATATHGSGLAYGPIADAAVAIDLVASGGRVIRVLPEGGDAGALPEGHEVIENDEWFDAVRVGMGCMGLTYAVTLCVREAYWLKEVRKCSTWAEVQESMLVPPLQEEPRFEIYMNPYQRKGGNRCLITTRTETQERRRLTWGGRRRNSIPEFLALLTPVTPRVLNAITDCRPEWTPAMLDRALKALADKDYTNVSYKVLNIGTANLLPAYSAEIGVPVDGKLTHIHAVDRVIEVAAEHARCGRIYETSPISLRFVKASSAYMAMMHDRTTMMIELIQSTRTEGGFELLAAYEDALYELGGRPHWGQVNTLTGSNGRIGQMYDKFPEWLAIHGEINSTGVFDSPFSKRVGIAGSST